MLVSIALQIVWKLYRARTLTNFFRLSYLISDIIKFISQLQFNLFANDTFINFSEESVWYLYSVKSVGQDNVGKSILSNRLVLIVEKPSAFCSHEKN